MTSAGSVGAARPDNQQVRGGSIPTPALHALRVILIAISVAKMFLVRHHYLHSLPRGTFLAPTMLYLQ